MKYLKTYTSFNEEVEFDVSPTDPIDVKMSKEKYNELKNQFDEYKQKKSQIDNVFIKFKNDSKKIDAEIEKLLGKTSEDRNPFLVEYLHVSKMDYEITKLQEENVKDKLSLDDFNREMSITKDETLKKSIQSKIADIKNRMSHRSKKIADIKKESIESKKKHDEKIKKMDQDFKDYINKISSVGEK